MLDTYDTHSPLNPSNQEETAEEVNDDNLEYKLKNQIRATQYQKQLLENEEQWNMQLSEKIALMKNDFKKLKDIEEMYSMLGNLSFEEQKQKQEILNKY